jgi:SPP1 family predicted phage head-tail adaptor
MKIGKLRHRVVLEELVTDQDSDGALTEEWVPVGQPLSAGIVALSGSALIAAQAVQSKVATRITVRYRPGVKASMRVVHRGTAYNIEAIVPDENSGQRFLTLLCSSGVNQG